MAKTHLKGITNSFLESYLKGWNGFRFLKKLDCSEVVLDSPNLELRLTRCKRLRFAPSKFCFAELLLHRKRQASFLFEEMLEEKNGGSHERRKAF